MKVKLVFALLIATILSVFAYRLYAQKAPNSSLRIDPVSLDLSLTPGKPTTGEMRLDNLSKDSVQVTASEENFTAQGEEGQVNLTNEANAYSLAQWIKVTPATITIPGNSSYTFHYQITAPANAEPGGHFGSIVFTTIPQKNLKGSGAFVAQEIGSLILARIPGPVTEEAKIVSFAADKNFYEYGPVTFTARVQNNSTIHIAPIGVVTIKNELTGKTEFAAIDSRNVLPQAIRRIPAVWNNHFLFGKYSAVANLSYGDKGQTLVASTEFYGFPVTYGIIALVILVVLFFLRKRLFKALRVIIRGK